MYKCKRYPECDCHNDWEKPAKEIDPANAEMFATLKQEIENNLDNAESVKYHSVIELIRGKLELLPEKLQPLFISKIFPFITKHYSWRMPEKSDLIKLRKALIVEISAKNELSYYTDKRNLRNQNLVQQTINYFTTGEGARAFKPLEFLNLLERQYHFVVSNIKEEQKVISYLKALPLTELENHILLGLLLKWFGGYPVHNLNEDFNNMLKLIQKEFLSYEGETPEKEFCKADFEQRKKFMKLGIAHTTAINYNLDAKKVYEAMGEPEQKEKVYFSFDELFEDAARNDAFRKFENQEVYLIERSRYNFEFNIWLQEIKGWEYGDEQLYKEHLNKQTFLEFLQFQKEEELKRIAERQKEVQSWKIDEPKTIDSVEEFIEMMGKPNDFEPLKTYIRDYYLNVHPNKLTLEELERIKRNINKWKLKLKDLKKAPELQEFIADTIADIDLHIERYLPKQPAEIAQPEFSRIIKKEKPREFIGLEYALAYILELHVSGKQIPKNRVEGGYDAKELKRIGKDLYGFEKPDTFYRAVLKVASYDLNKEEFLEAISKDWLAAVKALSKNWNAVSKYLAEKQLIKE